MERLTEEKQIGPWASLKDKAEAIPGAFANYDCLMAHMTAVTRLKAYEDTGLMPDEIRAMQEEHFSGLEMAKLHSALMELKKYQEADKDGRLVVLPCKPDGSMLDTSDPERPEIMKRIHFAVAYVCGGIVFHQPYSIFLENVAAGYIRPLNEEAEKALEVE